MPTDTTDTIRREPGPGGLERLVISTPHAQAHVFRHGAHVTHFQPRGHEPVLWLSPDSRFEPGHPIRGGVPICFPWFGPQPTDPAAPQHGPARLREWDLLAADTLDNGSARVSFSLKLPPFVVTHTVTVGRALVLRLDVYNASTAAATFEAALHTYLAVGDVRQVRIVGLDNAAYIDKTDAGRRKTQPPGPLTLTAQTDRVYISHESAVEVHDPLLKRTITIDKTNSHTTILWNPWSEKAATLPDFPDDAWPRMLCIETANAADNTIHLGPRRSHTTTATISVERSD